MFNILFIHIHVFESKTFIILSKQNAYTQFIKKIAMYAYCIYSLRFMVLVVNCKNDFSH